MATCGPIYAARGSVAVKAWILAVRARKEDVGDSGAGSMEDGSRGLRPRAAVKTGLGFQVLWGSAVPRELQRQYERGKDTQRGPRDRVC